ncbi:MAG TPA: cyclic nucleotide-binding domain-containing protein [Chloroflexota bacterium]|nr:cyclic nucleotide-binding domain-containing protein [Chloroflexota bacterium]
MSIIPSPTSWRSGPMMLDDEDVVSVCRIGLFQNLSPKDIMFLVRVSHTVIADEGATVISQNSVGDFFYIIVDGLLRVRVNAGGKSIVVAYLTRGQYVGEKAIMEGTLRGATCEAARETRLVRVPGFTFRRIMSRPENRGAFERVNTTRAKSNARLGVKS